jgi:type IV pilus assembly protein PilA
MNFGMSLRVPYSELSSEECSVLPDSREQPPTRRSSQTSLFACVQSAFRRRVCGCAQPSGFTLMELLIVISIILILMLMAMPTVGGIKKHANETSAVNSEQAIVTAEIMYASSYPAKGFACSLTALGGDPASGAPTPAAAQLIQSDLASGYKSGYIFKIGNCVKSTVGRMDYVKGYTVTAVPETVGKTGDRGFCSDQNGGSPKYDPAGGTNCTQLLLQ